MSALDIRVLREGKWVHYRRTGACNGCAECCKGSIKYNLRAWTENAYDLDEGDWSAWEGWAFFKHAGLMWAVWAGSTRGRKPCPLLKTRRCTYWKQRGFRAICALWPTKPADVRRFPKCGYHFEQQQ